MKQKQSGFTIVELMIATAVFSVVLLLCATAIVQVGKIFYKGITINRTQDTARRVSEDLSQAIQFGVRSDNFLQTKTNGATNSLCLGNVRYNYNNAVSLGTHAAQSAHVLWKDNIATDADCGLLDISRPAPSLNGVELLAENMRIPILNVTVASGVWTVNITVAYGDTEDLFEAGSNFTHCISNYNGGQYCAVSNINTNVIKRL